MVRSKTDIPHSLFLSMQCQAGPSVRGFIEQIFMEPTKIMIIGADCSVSSSPIAELAPFYNLAQVCICTYISSYVEKKKATTAKGFEPSIF